MGNSFKVKWTTEGGETGVKDLEPTALATHVKELTSRACHRY